MRIAVIGSGISGVSAAWLLSRAHDVDVYEAEAQLGGHTRTLDLTAGGVTFPVDTGFQVFNRRTYPNLIRFFEHLGIDANDADMSFSVQVGRGHRVVGRQSQQRVRPAQEPREPPVPQDARRRAALQRTPTAYSPTPQPPSSPWASSSKREGYARGLHRLVPHPHG